MRQLLVVVALCLSAAACDETPTSPTLPATFKLAPGESATAEGARVTFVRVESDSRCPIDALCIAEGDATITVRVSANGLDGEYLLALRDPSKRSVTHRGYRITFVQLEPPQHTQNPPRPEDYRASVEVAR